MKYYNLKYFKIYFVPVMAMLNFQYFFQSSVSPDPSQIILIYFFLNKISIYCHFWWMLCVLAEKKKIISTKKKKKCYVRKYFFLTAHQVNPLWIKIEKDNGENLGQIQQWTYSILTLLKIIIFSRKVCRFLLGFVVVAWQQNWRSC